MKILISGGCKNGKSSLAEKIAMCLPSPHYYIATMRPRDDEDRERIRRHREEREGYDFQTLELTEKKSISGLFGEAFSEEKGRSFLKGEEPDPKGTFLVDALTSLLAEEMFAGSCPDEEAAVRLEKELSSFIEKVSHVIFISDGIYSDAICYDAYTEGYRRGLSYLERRLCEQMDMVLELSAGVPVIHKPREEIASLKDSPKEDKKEPSDGIRELVIGGCFQGKESYVMEKYGLLRKDIYVCPEPDFEAEVYPIDRSAACISHIERYVLFCVKKGLCPDADFGGGVILIGEDISCGIVPLEDWQRAWREENGRFLSALSKRAREVSRLFAGIVQPLKGEGPR